jgi:pimeloyl-ACP methyl ester carboxylesterase
VALLARPGGVELHWEERGAGPLVVLAPYWSGHGGVYEAMFDDLARDHRVVTWDARGTGRSTRTGPYDMETDSADLEATLDETGGSALVICVADGCNRAVHVASRRPDLVAAVVALGAGPFARTHFEGSEGMLASETVVKAFLDMVRRDYRGALRTLLAATNPQMSEAERRERVSAQIDYCPQEAAAARVQAWAEDDPTKAAVETGERLWIFSAPDVAGPWLPPPEERRKLVETHTPRAHLVEGEQGGGPISRPDLTANLIRQITRQPRLESIG